MGKEQQQKGGVIKGQTIMLVLTTLFCFLFSLDDSYHFLAFFKMVG